MPHLGLSFTESISEDTFADFNDTIDQSGLKYRIECREEDGPYAGMEWLLPTAVVLFITRSYFQAFLSEMGKDHYALLKKGLKSLHQRLIGDDAPDIKLVSTRGKTQTDNPYSFVFSIYAEVDYKRRIKLLIQEDLSQQDYEKIIDAFLEFLEDFHAGTLDEAVVVKLKGVRPVGGTILIALDLENNELTPVDPKP